MEFKQKAEEKKMSMSKNIARLAVTAGLTAALSFGGVMAPVTMAFAAESGTTATANSITINKINGNENVKYKAYQIFKAKVTDVKSSGKTVQDVEWANKTIGAKVINAITNWSGYSSLSTENQLPLKPTAADVADWLIKNVDNTFASSADGATKGTRVAPGDVLYAIANVVKEETPAGTNIQPGGEWTPTASGNGYYLFVTDGLDQAKPDTGTSPIFAIVGGSAVTVTEKTSIPTVDKKILNDKKNKTAESAGDSDWENVGDSQVGQEVDYKLTGTVADNIASYATYTYEFQDTLSKGLVVTKGVDGTPKGLRVYIVNGNSKTEVKPDATNGYQATVTSDSNTKIEQLKVSFENLKDVQDADGKTIKVEAASNVVVTYKAQLTSDASYEATGNPNTVKLVYSNNPMAEGTGTSVEKTVTDHVFCLDVTKVDSVDSNKKLNAGFKVKVVENEDTASVGRWLKEDGSLTSNENEAHEFMTNNTSGEVKIPGLDAGKYQITETTTPEGYNTIAPFTITVTPNYDDDGKLTGLTVIDDSDMVDPGTANGAAMPLTIKNKKGSGLPLTGLNGVAFTWIAGGAVLCIGVAHLIRSRKQAEESEQE